MSVSAITPIGSESITLPAVSPLNPSAAGPLSGDAGALVQAYGAAVLAAAPIAAVPIVPALARTAVSAVDPVLPVGPTHIDTYA